MQSASPDSTEVGRASRRSSARLQGPITSRDQPARQLKRKYPGNPREDTARRMPDLISPAKKPWPAVNGDAAGRSRENYSSFDIGLRESLRQDRGVTDGVRPAIGTQLRGQLSGMGVFPSS